MCEDRKKCGMCESLQSCGYKHEAKQLCETLSQVSGRCNGCPEHESAAADDTIPGSTKESAYDPFGNLFRSLGWAD